MAKKNLKKFTVEYWEHIAVWREVEAETEEEAREKMQEMVECGEVDMSNAEIGDCGYEVMQ